MSSSLSLEHAAIRSAGRFACRLCGEYAARQLPEMLGGPKIFHCRHCGVAFADHPSRSNVAAARQDHFSHIDEEKYFRSVMATRLRSYSGLVKRVKEHVARGSWLDIGCSYGWLLKYIRENGYEGSGIEPSPAAAEKARNEGLKVREGLFPEALSDDEEFDVISFLDVLEHFENPAAALLAAREHLTKNGVLVLQVPDQACWLFRIALSMHQLTGGRMSFALRRLWLDGFDFPHRFYFTLRTLSLLLRKCGFQVLDSRRVSIGSPWEALDRVAYAESGKNRFTSTLVGISVGLINGVDAACGHGGLLSVIARPVQANSPATSPR